jgi:hypothetical protein
MINPKMQRPYSTKRTRVECKDNSDSSNGGRNWNRLGIIHKIPGRGKYKFKTLQKTAVLGTADGADVKVQNIQRGKYRVSEKDCTLFNFYFLGAQCVESGVSCTDCY